MKRRKILVSVALLIGVLALVTGCLFMNQAPTASFTAAPTSGPAPLAVTFDASASSDPDGSITTYTWNFGDGQNGAGVNGVHIYQNEGTYTAVLTVIDNNGAMATSSQVITVEAPENVPPSAEFTPTPDAGAAPLTVMFNAAASADPDGTITSYDWDFGDGSPHGSGVAVAHTYTAAGSYVVILTVTDNGAMESTATHTIEVSSPGNAVPTASFTTDPTNLLFAAPPVTIAFDASASSDPDGTIVSYNWNFGDGTADTGVTASHTYTDSGTYTVILTVIDDQGAPASATKTVSVLNLSLTPIFTPIPGLSVPVPPEP